MIVISPLEILPDSDFVSETVAVKFFSSTVAVKMSFENVSFSVFGLTSTEAECRQNETAAKSSPAKITPARNFGHTFLFFALYETPSEFSVFLN